MTKQREEKQKTKRQSASARERERERFADEETKIYEGRLVPPRSLYHGHYNRSRCSGNQSMFRGPNSLITTRWPWKFLLSRWGTPEEQSSLRPGRAVPSSHSNWMTRWFAWGPFCGRQNFWVDLSNLLVAPNVEASERLHQDVWHLC